ncbi:Alkaline phosphatase synthesis sensor protein PhoR [Stieleria bergensis]|uniref:histidine kinase n=1 Tax=Stieleria bergensis TaxID=2528025 RepID=A0A517T0N8_9BACT|nr:Alkaline phosphatase synthesis sensor protein PhoR [Planctomycetes bacterium SV_7m_r]
MLEGRSIKAPVTLGVTLIVLVVTLGVIWALLSFLGIFDETPGGVVFWTLFVIGSLLLITILVGVIFYLALAVKAFRLNQRQSNFIDSVTHELKSPLASIKLYLQTVSRHSIDEAQKQDFYQIMLEDIERLDALIDHLLDTALVDRGQGSDDEQVFRLDELIQQCAQAACMRYRVAQSTVDLQGDPTWIHSNALQLEILFRNLIDNAIKYGGNPTNVVASIRRSRTKEDQVIVSIADNGKGIPYDMRRKIFGRFVRIGSELQRSKPGTGLGLHLVRTISRTLGAAVRIYSRTDFDGVDGTVFEVTLRHAEPPPEPHETANSDPDLTS